jgi:hypothetical protein
MTIFLTDMILSLYIDRHQLTVTYGSLTKNHQVDELVQPSVFGLWLCMMFCVVVENEYVRCPLSISFSALIEPSRFERG